MPHRVLLGIVLMPVILLAVYWPSLGGGPVWDDRFLVGANPFFRSPYFVLEVFRHFLFLDLIAPYYRPVQNWSYMLDYVVWGDWFAGYHLGSVLWHATAALLLWRLAYSLLGDGLGEAGERRRGRLAVGYAVAMLWAVHPAHAPAVAYVSGRADPLAVAGVVAGWLLFRTWAARPARRWILLAAMVALLLGLCSRETGLIWLGAFAVYEGVARPARPDRRRLAAWVAGGVALAVYALLRRLPGEPHDAEPVVRGTADSLWLTMLALGDYLGLFLAPIHLAMERQLLTGDESGVGLAVAALAGVVILGLLAAVPGSSRRLRVFSVFGFLGGFLAVAPLTPRNALVAEHWMYGPYFLLLLGLGALAGDLLAGDFGSARLRRLLPAVAGVIFLAWSARTVTRAGDWSTHRDFVSRTMTVRADSPRMVGVLANHLIQVGRPDEAVTLIEKALGQMDMEADAVGARLLRVQLGVARARLGQVDKALDCLLLDEAELRELSRVHPYAAVAPRLASELLWERGQLDQAVRMLVRAADIWPDHWGIHEQLAVRLTQAGELAATETVLRSFHARHPWHPDATLRLGHWLTRHGDAEAGRRLLAVHEWMDVRKASPPRDG